MRLTNIHNQGRLIYKFIREDNGELRIETDNSFFPYFYEEHPEGRFNSYDGKKLKKLYANHPKEIKNFRTSEAYEGDIIFTRRYLIDKVKKLHKTQVKYAFIDIEIMTDELPDVKEAKYPVSVLTVYNSQNQEYKTFRLDEYSTEFIMLEDFCNYLKQESFDLWLSWNVNFDYDYLYNRFPDFAKNVSPIGQLRYGHDEIAYPAGISIVDYLTWMKKVTLNKLSS